MNKRSTSFQVFTCLITLALVIVLTLLIRVFYKKYKKEFLPVHIFQLNLGISYTARVSFLLYVSIIHTDVVTERFQSTFNFCRYYIFGLFIFRRRKASLYGVISVGRSVGLSVFQTRFQTSCPEFPNKLCIVFPNKTHKKSLVFCVETMQSLFGNPVWTACLESRSSSRRA